MVWEWEEEVDVGDQLDVVFVGEELGCCRTSEVEVSKVTLVWFEVEVILFEIGGVLGEVEWVAPS